MLLFPIVWGLFCAIFPLVSGMIHSNALHGCGFVWVTENVPNFWNANKYHLFYFLAFNLPRWISLIIAFVAMSLVYATLRKDELDCGCEPTVGFLLFVKSATQTEAEGGPDDSKLKWSKRMTRQASFYLLSCKLLLVSSC
jgi:hypothetical protein